MTPARRVDDTLFLELLVSSRTRNTELGPTVGDRLKMRVKSPPIAGKANDEIIRYLAKRFRMQRHGITIVAGPQSRRKTVRLQFASVEVAESVLQAILAQQD